MGFCYEGRKLCCDICGTAGARKVRCPFGYCPATAACSTCRKTRKDILNTAAHRIQGCEEGHRKFVEREERKARLLAEGQWLRCSAYGPSGVVKVGFRNADGAEKQVLMPLEVYKAFPLATPVTLEDYERVAGVTLPLA